MLDSLYNKFRRITSNQLYFPEIDGIRFVAILLVVLFHIHGYFIAKTQISFTDSPDRYNLLNTLMENGDRGVELFFVLSGFILCLPFAYQYLKDGKKVQLKKYYLRRVTRLEPPYFIAMTAIFVMHLILHTYPAGVVIPSWLASLVYLHGIIYHHTPLLTVVAWSLEIEIQFYLLAPFLFRVLSWNKTSRRVMLVSSIAGFVCLQYIFPPSFSSIYGFVQYFLTGILLADLYVSDTATRLFQKKWTSVLSVVTLIAVVYLPFKGRDTNSELRLLLRIIFPFLVGLFYYSVLKNSFIKSLFSYKFIPIIGGMCYTIYLLHYTIISFLGRFTIPVQLTQYYLPNLLLQVVLLGAAITLVSAIYYYYVERPFMSSKWLDMLMKKDRSTPGAQSENR